MKEHKRHIGLESELIRMNVVQMDLSYKVLEESILHDKIDKTYYDAN